MLCNGFTATPGLYQCYTTIIVQPPVLYCSVCKTVDGTHFVRYLLSIVNKLIWSIMSDWYYRAYSLDLYLEISSIFMCSFMHGQETMLS